MPLTSAEIANQIYAANAAMVGANPAMGGAMPSGLGGLARGGGGMMGERIGAGIGSMGVAGVGMGRLGAELAAGSLGSSAGMGLAGMMGAGVMGAGGMAMAGSLAFTLPVIAVGSVFRAYSGAFTGGMQEQGALNSTIRNNFNFQGGQGAMGHGFSQGQMGQIGGIMGREMRGNPFGNMQELNSLIAGGADSGMMTGVRDVQQFGQSFRKMLDTLKSVQRELGGTLTDALSFVRSSQQAGIFQNADRVNFAAEVRSAEAVTGMDRTQLTALAATGANISRAAGGLGRQGAIGALRGVQTLGAAISTGAIDASQLSEATGGLTGADALSAFTQSTMARSARFSRTGMGRFSLFAMANEEGNGLDADMMRRFRAGDISVGDVSRRAHSNAHGMGRATALNNEGRLRGEMMEEGGMSGQIGMMRLMLGDRVMDRGDDFASLVMQRRFHMSRPESEVWTNLMRNQGRIAEREDTDRIGARREADYNTELRTNRSADAFMSNLEHGISETSGLTRAREMGRDLVTRLSSVIERAANNIVGTAGTALSEGTSSAFNRAASGRGTRADAELIIGALGTGSGNTSEDLFRGSLAGNALHGVGLHGMSSIGERLERRGVRGLHGAGADGIARDAISDARRAAGGFVRGDSATALAGLEENSDDTIRRVLMARSASAGAGDREAFYEAMGGDANATDAFLARNNLAGTGLTPGRGAMRGLGGPSPMDVMRTTLGGGVIGAWAGRSGGLAGMAAGAVAGSGYGLASFGMDASDDSVGFLAGGGHLGGRLAYSEEGARAAFNRGDRSEAAMMRLSVSGISEESVRAVTNTDSYRSRIARINGMSGDTEGMMREVAELRREAAGEGVDEGHARALTSIAAQMEDSITRNGGLGSEFAGASRDERAEREARDRLADMAHGARGLGTSLDGLAGGSGLRDAFSDAAKSFTEGGREGVLGGMAANRAAREMLIGMDPDSAEYREIAEALGSDDSGAGGAMLTSASESRRRRRDLTGRGRRGGAGAAAEMLNSVSGGRASELNLMSGGRRVSATGAYGLLRRGGAGADDVINSMTESMRGMGVTNASELTNELRGLAEGGFTNEEAATWDRRVGEEMETGSLGRAAARANEESMRRANPLDAARNDLLTQIRDGIRGIRGEDGSGQPRGEAS